MSKLWLITDPPRDWYEYVFINGDLSRAAMLPVVGCPDCGEPWSSRRTLPIVCPDLLRKELEALTDEHLSLSYDRFLMHARRWEQILRQHNSDCNLMPGDCLLPLLWKVPSIPRYEFFWKTTETIVNERMMDRFLDLEVTSLSFQELVLQKVGLSEPTDHFSIPQSGDMVDFFEENPYVENPVEYGRFFHIDVFNHTTIPVSPETLNILAECSTCGHSQREETIPYRKVLSYYRKRRLIPRNHVLDTDIFWSHIFPPGYVINQKVRELISDEPESNCRIQELTVIEDPK